VATKAKKASTGPRPGTTLRRRQDEGRTERVSALIDQEVAKALRLYCAENRCSLSGAIEQAVREMLDRGADG
jgi:hypothetical protein